MVPEWPREWTGHDFFTDDNQWCPPAHCLPYSLGNLIDFGDTGGCMLHVDCIRRDTRVAWRASCGCMRVTTWKTLDEILAKDCHEDCKAVGCEASLLRCTCSALMCKFCKIGAHALSTAQITESPEMLQLTKKVFQERRALGHDWFLIVEVPWKWSDENGRCTTLYIDCLLVLNVPPWVVGSGHAGTVFAVEFHGSSHSHPYPVGGDRHVGMNRQIDHDARKRDALQSQNIELLELEHCRGGSMSEENKIQWKSRLRSKMLHVEQQHINSAWQ